LPVPVAPAGRVRPADRSAEAISRTSPLHFVRKDETVSQPAVPARKDMPVPGHWRNQRRAG